jgi:hypothetical protein
MPVLFQLVPLSTLYSRWTLHRSNSPPDAVVVSLTVSTATFAEMVTELVAPFAETDVPRLGYAIVFSFYKY